MPTWSSTNWGNYLKYTTFYQDTHNYRNPEVIQKQTFLEV